MSKISDFKLDSSVSEITQQNTTQKTKIEQVNSTKIQRWNLVLWKDNQFLLD
jgi:hypothetical protein